MKLGTPTEKQIRQAVRMAAAINLTAFGELIRRSWGFSVIVDGATHLSFGYLDVRLSYSLDGCVRNFDFLAIPTGTLGHTGRNYVDLVIAALTDIAGNDALQKLIGIATDGAANMLGCRRGFVKLVREACTQSGGGDVVANWCGCHQLNLAVGTFLSLFDDFVGFRSVLGCEISFTHMHDIVRTVVGNCPSYADTRWDSIHDSCQFLERKYPRLVEMQREKGYNESSDMWWLVLFFIADIVRSFKVCFARLQYKKVTSSEQYEAMQSLAKSLQNMFEENDSTGGVVMSEVKIESQICKASPYALPLYTRLCLEERQQLLLAVRDAVQQFLERVLEIRMEIDPYTTNMTTLKEMDVSNDQDFSKLLNVHQTRLSNTFGGDVISIIWAERKDLQQEYHNDRRVKNMVDRVSDLDINGAWNDRELDARFSSLKAFALDLASIPPGTHTVEADFSILKRMKSKYRTRLSDFSLEGEMHATQYFDMIEAAASRVID